MSDTTDEEYRPYGTSSFQVGRSAGEVSLKRYRYTGKERDGESGLNYHGARYYAPWLGRWTVCDPLGVDATVNGLVYGRANPIRFLDPFGMEDYEWPKGASFISPDNTATNGTLAHQEVLPKVAGRINSSGFFSADTEVRTLSGGSKASGSWSPGEIDLRVYGSTQGNKILDLKPLGGTEDARVQTGNYALHDNTVFSSKRNDRPITNYASNALEPVEAGNRTYLLSQDSTASPEKLEYYRYDKVTTKAPAGTLARVGGAIVNRGRALAGAVKQAAKSQIPGSEIYDEVKSVGGGSVRVGAQLMARYTREVVAQNAQSVVQTGRAMVETARAAGSQLLTQGTQMVQQAGRQTVAAGSAAVTAISSASAAAGTLMTSSLSTIAAGGATTVAAAGALVVAAGAVGYGIGTVLNKVAVEPLLDKFSPGSGALGEWYYNTFLK